MMPQYTREKWFELFRCAMMKVGDPAMHQRIELARVAMTARLTRLEYPPDSAEERQALQDGLKNLAVLGKLRDN